ncbi:MAG: Bro-N domain-containing protein [Vicingaceae bacterium]|nr:Bro-N domain-containing protein [Vicingaceae bacterium]
MKLELINNSQFGEVRTQITNGEPHFVAKDLCAILDIKNNREAVRNIDDDYKGSVVCDTPGGKQKLVSVNEYGLYILCFRSNKPQAKAFTKWIVTEVIPSIRKYGTYTTDEKKKERIERKNQIADVADMFKSLGKYITESDKRLAAKKCRVSYEYVLKVMQVQVACPTVAEELYQRAVKNKEIYEDMYLKNVKRYTEKFN